MINEKVLRDQLAKPGLLPWIESYFDDLRTHFKMVEDKIHNVTFINVSNVESFKKSVEEFQRQNPNAKVYATAFVFGANRCLGCGPECPIPLETDVPKSKNKPKKKVKSKPKKAKRKK